MDEEFEVDMRMIEIQEKIREGSYRVDPRAVADAIVRQLLELAAATSDYRTSPQRPLNT